VVGYGPRSGSPAIPTPPAGHPGIAATLLLAVLTGLLLGPGRVLALSDSMDPDRLARHQLDLHLESMGARAPELATSWAEGDLPWAVNIVVGPTEITVIGSDRAVPLVRTDDGLVIPAEERLGQHIQGLRDALNEAQERQDMRQLLRSGSANPRYELLITLDASLPFSVTLPVLYTAANTGYGDHIFVVHNPWLDRYTTILTVLPSWGIPPLPGPPDERPPLSLRLELTDRGIAIFGANGAAAVPCKSGGSCTGLDDYDWAELSRLLSINKDSYPDELQVTVALASTVTTEVLLRTLDVARWSPIPEEDAAAHADWQRTRRTLFDLPIVAGGPE